MLQLTFDPTHSWMEMEGESSQLKKQVDQLQNSVTGLIAKNKQQENKIKNLEKMQFDMNERLRAQERYTSKDCLIICNPPFDPRDSKNVLKNNLRFFSDFLKINLTENRIKACHILPGTANGDQYDSVICKFVYFDEKDRVFGARRKLKTAKNSLNKKPIFLNERLPKFEAELRAEANRQGFITSTKNCSVSVLVKRNNNDTGYHNINQISDLENVKNPIKRENQKRKYCLDDEDKVDDEMKRNHRT